MKQRISKSLVERRYKEMKTDNLVASLAWIGLKVLYYYNLIDGEERAKAFKQIVDLEKSNVNHS